MERLCPHQLMRKLFLLMVIQAIVAAVAAVVMMIENQRSKSFDEEHFKIYVIYICASITYTHYLPS